MNKTVNARQSNAITDYSFSSAIGLAANRSESVSNLLQIGLGMFGLMSGHISVIDSSVGSAR